LARLEHGLLLGVGAPAVRVLFNDELVPCSEHAGCSIECATSAHLANVIHLTFDEAAT
jgi:hypothetical protein